MYTRIKSTVTGLAAVTAALMLSYAFGDAPSVAQDVVPGQMTTMVIGTLGAESGGEAETVDSQPRRHMSRVLATPYLSVGRLLPRRGS